MARLRKLLFGVIWLLVFALVLVGVADNSSEVTLTYLDYHSPSLSLAWWILLAFISGVLVGYLMSLAPILRGKLDVRRTRRELTLSEKEVRDLRARPTQAEQAEIQEVK